MCAVRCWTGAGIRRARSESSPACDAGHLSMHGPICICGARALDSRGCATCTASSWGSALPNAPWCPPRVGASMGTPRVSGGGETTCDTKSTGVGGAAGPVRTAHQVRLVPSTRPQHPTIARTGPGRLRWGWSVPTPQARHPGHHASSARPPRRRSWACWRWATRSRIWRWKSGGADVWNKRNKARISWGVQGGLS